MLAATSVLASLPLSRFIAGTSADSSTAISNRAAVSMPTSAMPLPSLPPYPCPSLFRLGLELQAAASDTVNNATNET
jgi:hypothetical protein